MTEEHLRQIETIAGYGLTEAMIARAVLGIAERTWRDVKARDPRVSAVFERGKAVAGVAVGQALFKRAVAGEGWAVRWYEMTRQGRSEKVSAEHSGPGGRPITTEDVSQLSAQQRADRLHALLSLARERQEGGEDVS